MESSWRLIRHGPMDAYWNMAVDEAIFLTSRRSECKPTLRFYTWDRPSISLGRFQKVAGSIDVDFCRKRNIPIVRRPTGGRGVLHGTDLTFSVVNNNSDQSVEASYALMSRIVVDALGDLGVPAQPFRVCSDRNQMGSTPNCFDLHAGFEVGLDGRKTLGSAQLRQEGRILQQNSLVLETPCSDNLNAFVGSCPQQAGSCIGQYADSSMVMRAICKKMEETLKLSFLVSDLEPVESELARRLLTAKYETPEWNMAGSRIVDTQFMSVLY